MTAALFPMPKPPSVVGAYFLFIATMHTGSDTISCAVF